MKKTTEMAKPKTYKYVKAITVGHKPDGRPIRKYIRENDKKMFNAKVRYYQNLIAKGVQVVGRSMTVEQWAWQWYHTYKEPKIGASQKIVYENDIKNHITPAIGIMALNAVKPYNIQELVNGLKNQINGKPLSKHSVGQVIQTLKQMFEQAEINGLIEVTPCRRIENTASEKKTRRALSENEEAAIRKVAARHYAGAWVLLMLDCGLRSGETVALESAAVKDGFVNITSSASYAEGNQAIKKGTKSSAGVRRVPISDTLVSRLDLSSRYVFGGSKMITKTKRKRMWSSFIRSVDLSLGAKTYRNRITEHAIDTGITPHYLRHTYCTNLRRKGIDLKTAQYLMGHADISTTANIYNHVSEDDLKNVAKLLHSHS